MKKIVYIIAWLGMFLLPGCMETDDTRMEPNPVKDGMVRFCFTLPSPQSMTKSVAAETGENTVNDLTLLFFEPTTNGNGKYLGVHEVAEEDIPLVETNQFSLDVRLKNLSKSADYSILAIANLRDNVIGSNASDFEVFIDQIDQMTEMEVIRYVKVTIDGVGNTEADQNDNTKAMIASNLLMACRSSKAASAEVVDCLLERAVVRFDVVNKVTGYRLVSASIWNAFRTGYAWSDAEVDFNNTRTGRYYGLRNESTGYDMIKGKLYAFENVQVNPDPSDDKTTCLVFGLQPVTSSPGEDITYHRVNVHPKERGQYLKRNHVYQVTLSAVNGDGEATEWEAVKKGSRLLDTSINSWDRDGDGLIIRDGNNLLAVPTSRAVFGVEAEERQYYVYTLGTGTLEIKNPDLPTGMEAWLGGKGNDLFIKVSDYPYEKRTGSFELHFAGMKGVVEVYQSGEKEKFLRLEYDKTMPVWPAGTISGIPDDSFVRVFSSGPWTAEIYNGNFSFSNGSEVSKLQGDNNYLIDEIYTTGPNTNAQSHHSFILISLDADPDNYRSALILVQAGVGGFTTNPNTTEVLFEPDGSLSGGLNNYDTFTIEPGDLSDTWLAEVIPVNGYLNNFEIDYVSGNTTANPGKVTGAGSFTIRTKGPNYSSVAQATIRVTHNNTNTRNITAKQGQYTFGLSHEEISGVESVGGITIPVSVLSNKPGATWSATVQGNSALIPKLVFKGQEVSSIIGAALNESFQVRMPGIDQHLTEAPFATVTVKLDGTDMERTLVVNQNPVKYVTIHVQTWRPDYPGSFWQTRDASFNKWGQEMVDPDNFGVNGTVYSMGVTYGTPQEYWDDKWYGLKSFDGARPRVLNFNGCIEPFGKGIEEQSSTLNNDPYFVYILSAHLKTTIFDRTGFNNVYTYNSVSGVGTKTFTINHYARTVNPALWDYLFVNGPFGPVTPDNISLTGTGYHGAVTRWPDTFIPLILNSSNEAVMGIDPVRKMIWVGEVELFSATPNWDNANSDNRNFLRNVLAWMVNVNNYGKPFLNRFVD